MGLANSKFQESSNLENENWVTILQPRQSRGGKSVTRFTIFQTNFYFQATNLDKRSSLAFQSPLFVVAIENYNFENVYTLNVS